MKLWLDDHRPAPPGWIHAKTVNEAKVHLETGQVVEASLDHDLGACEACMKGRSVEQWLIESGMSSMPHCRHFGTGLDLVEWMIATGHWPAQKPRVHSANQEGHAQMAALIDAHFEVLDEDDETPPETRSDYVVITENKTGVDIVCRTCGSSVSYTFEQMQAIPHMTLQHEHNCSAIAAMELADYAKMVKH